MVISPSMGKRLLEHRFSTSVKPCVGFLMHRVFGASQKSSKYESREWMKFMAEEPHISKLSSLLAKKIEQDIPNLVSFCPSIIDQHVWERMSEVTVNREDGGVSEARLHSLIRDFVGTLSTNTLMGKSLIEVYPNILPDIWTMNEKFNPIVLGIPAWFPYPRLPTAYIARRRLITCLSVLNTAFVYLENGRDPGMDWRDLDDVSEAVQARLRARVDQCCTTDLAAAEDLSLLWYTNVQTNTIIYWSLVHILSKPQLLSQIMEEIAPYAKAMRPSFQDTGFSLPEPPRLSLDVEGLVQLCSLLEATCAETFRLYSSSFTYRKVTKSMTLAESNEDAAASNRKPCTYHFKAGDYVAVPQSLCNNDPDHFNEPHIFDPSRFLDQIKQKRSTGNKSQSSAKTAGVDIPSAGVDEDPLSACREFEMRKAMAFVAAILVMWDIEPADGSSWTVPTKTGGSIVSEPKRDMRVKLRLRV